MANEKKYCSSLIECVATIFEPMRSWHDEGIILISPVGK